MHSASSILGKQTLQLVIRQPKSTFKARADCFLFVSLWYGFGYQMTFLRKQKAPQGTPLTMPSMLKIGLWAWSLRHDVLENKLGKHLDPVSQLCNFSKVSWIRVNILTSARNESTVTPKSRTHRRECLSHLFQEPYWVRAATFELCFSHNICNERSWSINCSRDVWSCNDSTVDIRSDNTRSDNNNNATNNHFCVNNEHSHNYNASNNFQYV